MKIDRNIIFTDRLKIAKVTVLSKLIYIFNIIKSQFEQNCTHICRIIKFIIVFTHSWG